MLYKVQLVNHDLLIKHPSDFSLFSAKIPCYEDCAKISFLPDDYYTAGIFTGKNRDLPL